jgi:eukaryotic-like serine/threonine-protein kinase
MLSHRGLMSNFPLGALAYLGLARSYKLQGDTAKAKAAYQDFLILWKDADPRRPHPQRSQSRVRETAVGGHLDV